MAQEPRVLPSANRHKEFFIEGKFVSVRDRAEPAAAAEKALPAARPAPPAVDILTIDEVARQPIEGVDSKAVLNSMANIGTHARLFVQSRDGKALRSEIFEDPRVCPDINRGAVVENLKEKPKDMSCLGDECGRCAIVCPENAIHLMGKGKGSFHEIDPLACKGCFICWVECYRTAADCILVDGKTFDPGMRAKHFGE